MPEPRPLRVLVVDDADIVVQGVARMVEPYGDRVRLAEAADPDIALLDAARVAGHDLDDVRRELRARQVVVWSWRLDPRRVQEALGKGASGYLAKMLPAVDLVAALERIHRGEVVVSPHASPGSSPGSSPVGARGERLGLTVRESEIIAMITEGLSNQQIADRAYLSINSVKSYIRSSYRKIGVTSRSRAVLWGIEHGFRVR